ncbi:hypothetical protein B0H14DRAFT_2569901 [Mycena olivaceomarginata]|nr:hypothetical protein B0H14DRAFT_2569901 [Mycena olivaceomarginata]
MRLWAAFWPLLVALSILLATMSPPSPPSSLAQRCERGIRQARIYASIAPYRSPRRQPGASPLRDIQNVPRVQHGPGVEEQRSIQRDADPRRPVPQPVFAGVGTPPAMLWQAPLPPNRYEARDENRAPSPTPVARRPVPQALVHLQRRCGRPRYLQINMP